MQKIQLLDQKTINKIAAGEVVESPKSVVKELTENAMDAGASTVTVEIKEGGISYIRVTDNGCGIPKEQVKEAFLRHATSKIEKVEDLEQIADFIFLINEGKKIFCDTKEELLETYLLVKGGREDLTPELKKQLIGLEENAFGFEALYSVKNGLPPAGWLSAKPSIDQIVVHIIEDMR